MIFEQHVPFGELVRTVASAALNVRHALGESGETIIMALRFEPESRQQLAVEVVSFLQQVTLPRPELLTEVRAEIDAWVQDGMQFCGCAACQAQLAKEGALKLTTRAVMSA